MLGVVGAVVVGAVFAWPICSTAVGLDLSRHGSMPRSLAIVHSVVAFAVVAIVFAMWTDSPVGGLELPRWFPMPRPGFPYALTWIAIGVSLIRGVPQSRATSG